MQVSVGTVSVANGDVRVISTEDSFSSDWSQIVIGGWFTTSGQGHNVAYQVAAKYDPSTTNSGMWELDLSTTYQGTTASAAYYAITNDFTTFGNIPLLHRGDAESATIFSRAMNTIASLLSGLTSRVTVLEGWIAPPAASTVHTVTLPSSSPTSLLAGKHYRLECTFSTGGTFTDIGYISSGAATSTVAQMRRNENGTTTGKMVWSVYAPSAVPTISFSGTLRGNFSAGTITLNSSQATWVLTQLD